MRGRQRQQRGRRAGAGGERQAAGDGEVVFGQPPHLADDDGERAALERVLEGLEQGAGVGRAHEDEAGEVEPVRDEAGAERRAALDAGEILDRQQGGSAPRGHEAGGQREREAEGGGRVGRLGRGDLVQRVAGEAAAETVIEFSRQLEPRGAGRSALKRG